MAQPRDIERTRHHETTRRSALTGLAAAAIAALPAPNVAAAADLAVHRDYTRWLAAEVAARDARGRADACLAMIRNRSLGALRAWLDGRTSVPPQQSHEAAALLADWLDRGEDATEAEREEFERLNSLADQLTDQAGHLADQILFAEATSPAVALMQTQIALSAIPDKPLEELDWHEEAAVRALYAAAQALAPLAPHVPAGPARRFGVAQS